MAKLTILTKVLPNGLHLDTDDVNRICETFKEGSELHLEVKRAKKRTSRQNRYYWGVVVSRVHSHLVDLGNDITSDDCHEFLKDRFADKVTIFDHFGVELGEVSSTAGMDTVEFSTYVERIRQWAAEFLGVYIESPDDWLQNYPE